MSDCINAVLQELSKQIYGITFKQGTPTYTYIFDNIRAIVLYKYFRDVKVVDAVINIHLEIEINRLYIHSNRSNFHAKEAPAE